MCLEALRESRRIQWLKSSQRSDKHGFRELEFGKKGNGNNRLRSKIMVRGKYSLYRWRHGNDRIHFNFIVDQFCLIWMFEVEFAVQ